MKLTNTREAGTEHGLKMLVHGPAGAGKTRLLSTTGDLEHTLILSAEAGLLSLRDFEIDVVVIKNLADLREAFTFVLAGLRGEEGFKPYTWVCLDSISEIAETVLAYEKSVNKNGLKAYGEMADTMFNIIRKFRDLEGINVVFTAKQERVTDEGRLIYAPMLPGKQLTQGIAYLFDLCFAMRSQRGSDGEVERFIQTINDGIYDAKDRSGALKPAEQPNLAAIAAKIHSATKGE